MATTWCIEQRRGNLGTRYLAGLKSAPTFVKLDYIWSESPKDAIQFVSKEDAEKLDIFINSEICEHQWDV